MRDTTIEPLKRTVVEAVNYLKNRYADLCLRFPMMSKDVCETEYVAVNLRYAINDWGKRA